MIALSLKGMKIQAVTHEKYGDQKVVTLGLSSGKFPQFNVMVEGVPHVARILPQPNAEGVWELKLILAETKGVAAEPKAFSTSKVAKTPAADPAAESTRLQVLEKNMAQLMTMMASLVPAK